MSSARNHANRSRYAYSYGNSAMKAVAKRSAVKASGTAYAAHRLNFIQALKNLFHKNQGK